MKSPTIYQPFFIVSIALSMTLQPSSTTLAFTYIASGREGNHGGGPASGEFVFLGSSPTKWEPGLNTASFQGFTPPDGPRTPGGASWSALPTGVPFSNTLGGSEETIGGGLHPDGATSTDIETFITPAVDGLEYAIFNAAFNVWTAVANITNLGQVADGATLIPAGEVGDLEASNGHVGDIRVGAFDFDGVGGTLAHAFQPGTEALFHAGGTIAGDIHFDRAETWVDDPNRNSASGGRDFFTIALHELGHALGLAHSPVEGSVMSPFYEGSRRALHADDIAGMRALYGEIPEPGGLTCLLLGVTILAARRKVRTAI